MSFDLSGQLPLMRKPSTLQLARLFLIVHTVALFFSPPLANLAEFLLWLSFLLVRDLRSGFVNFFSTRVGKLFLLFIGILCLGVVVAAFRGFVEYPGVWSWRKILIFPIAAVLYRHDDQARWRFAAWFMGASAVFSVYAIYSWLSGHSGDVFRNSSSQSVLFASGIAAAGFYALRSHNNLPRITSVIAMIICFSGLAAVTSGRSGYLGLLVMIVTAPFFLATQYSRLVKAGFAAFLVAVTAAALYLSPVSNSRIHQALSEFQAPLAAGENTSIGLRKIFWVNTIDMVPKYWLLGAGVTGFGGAYSKHMAEKADKKFVPTIDPHNQFLRILVEQGVIGLLVFLGLLWALLQLGTKSMSGALGASALLAWCATSLFSAHFTTFVEGRLIWVLMGVFLASHALVPKIKRSLTSR